MLSTNYAYNHYINFTLQQTQLTIITLTEFDQPNLYPKTKPIQIVKYDIK